MTPVDSEAKVDATVETEAPVSNGNLPGPAWLKVIYVFGVPAAIAMFLVWFNTASKAADMDRVLMNQQVIMDKLQAVDTQMSTANVNMRIFVEAQIKAEENRMRVMRQICINTAKDNQGMLKCAE